MTRNDEPDVIEPLGYVPMLEGEDAMIFEELIGVAPNACTGCGAIGWHTPRCPTNARNVSPDRLPRAPSIRHLAHVIVDH